MDNQTTQHNRKQTASQPPTEAEVSKLEPRKKQARPLDPVLLAAGRLDRHLAELPKEQAYWVLQYLMSKYGKKPEGTP